MNKNSGHSILEILIANILGLIILSALLKYIYLLINYYNYAQKIFSQQNAFLTAKHLITADLRNAKFNGCEKTNAQLSIVPNLSASSRAGHKSTLS